MDGCSIKHQQDWVTNVALKQAAVDLGCDVDDFGKSENVVVVNGEARSGTRKDLNAPFACHMVTFGSNVVASAQPEFEEIVKDYVSKCDIELCFATPMVELLNDAFRPFGYGVCEMAEYWLPDLSVLKPLPCIFETRVLTEFSDLYTDDWTNALCKERRHLDTLGVGAYDENGKLVGLAACSRDGEDMWQIGIDVLPEHRKKGIASALTSQLAVEILKRGKVPFYACAWCNVKSARNAQRSGFRLAWSDLRVQTLPYIQKVKDYFVVQHD